MNGSQVNLCVYRKSFREELLIDVFKANITLWRIGFSPTVQPRLFGTSNNNLAQQITIVGYLTGGGKEGAINIEINPSDAPTEDLKEVIAKLQREGLEPGSGNEWGIKYVDYGNLFKTAIDFTDIPGMKHQCEINLPPGEFQKLKDFLITFGDKPNITPVMNFRVAIFREEGDEIAYQQLTEGFILSCWFYAEYCAPFLAKALGASNKRIAKSLRLNFLEALFESLFDWISKTINKKSRKKGQQ